MARIEIYDDWGKLAETLHVVSADAKDLRKFIEEALGDVEIEQCVDCKKFDDQTNMMFDDEDNIRCVACDKAKGGSHV